MDFKMHILWKIHLTHLLWTKFSMASRFPVLKQENVYLLDHVHHLPCYTDIHGCSRTGVMLEFLAYVLWKTVPESSAALVLTTSRIVKSD